MRTYVLMNVYKKNREIIMYLFFGMLTTIVSFVSYFVCSDLFNIYYLLSNVISWILSVAFAYLTNKIWVFKSHTRGLKGVLKEITTFVYCRLMSGVIDMAIMYMLVSLLHANDLYSKLFTQVIVVILNYLFSKLIIFSKKQNPSK